MLYSYLGSESSLEKRGISYDWWNGGSVQQATIITEPVFLKAKSSKRDKVYGTWGEKWEMKIWIMKISWVMPQNLRDTYLSCSLWPVDKSIKKMGIMIPAVIFWCLWNERNKRCFVGISTPNHSIEAKCLTNLFCWTKLSPIVSTEHFLEFISSLVLDWDIV